jgi:CHASE2 domain-containing sensor protein
LCIGNPAFAQTTNPSTEPADFPYRAVFIDDKTEKELGAIPYDREVYARGIRELDKSGARAIVVMFFMDLPKSSKGDAEFAKAVHDSKAKVILQAALDKGEDNPNPLPLRFNLDIAVPPGSSLIDGGHGWLPLPEFAEHAQDIGFANLRIPAEMPLVEVYDDKPVKSIWRCALEAGFSDTALIMPGDSLELAHHRIKINSHSEIRIDPPAEDKIDSISFIDVLHGKVPKETFKDKVVLLGCDSMSMQTVDTKSGQFRSHRWCWHMLRSAYDKISAAPPA